MGYKTPWSCCSAGLKSEQHRADTEQTVSTGRPPTITPPRLNGEIFAESSHTFQRRRKFEMLTDSSKFNPPSIGHIIHYHHDMTDKIIHPHPKRDVFTDLSVISPAPSPSLSIPSTPSGIPVQESELSYTQRSQLPDTLPEVNCVARARIPTIQGQEIFLHLYSNNVDSKEHLAIVFGEKIRSKTLFKYREGETQSDRMTRGAYIGRLRPGRVEADVDDVTGEVAKFDSNGELINATSAQDKATLVRIHSECYTGETAWSARCDCGEQFDEAGRLMGKEGRGCIVYLRQEGRGIGLGEKLKAYNLQDLGADTVQANLLLRHPADARSFSLATAILQDLGLEEIKLLTNNPDKIVAVEGKDRVVKVVERVPMVPLAWKSNGGIKSEEVDGYLRTKIERMGHLLQKPINI